MSHFALRLPDSLAASLKRLAQENRVSMNQYVMMALAEKVGAIDTARFFSQRRARAKPALAAKVWSRVPDAAPLTGDELPRDVRARLAARSGPRTPRLPRGRPAGGSRKVRVSGK